MKMFADEGVKVIIADRATEKGAVVADEIVADGGEAFFLKLELQARLIRRARFRRRFRPMGRSIYWATTPASAAVTRTD